MENIPQQRQELEKERVKTLATKFEDFCIRAGDRMFSGKISNCEQFQLPTTHEHYTDENGRKMIIESGGGLDFSKKELFKYDDDEYFSKLLNHPAFKEKINTSNIIIDIGNGGNMALRVDADFLKRNGFRGKLSE